MTQRAELLYVTRKYPPSVGGMERLAWSIARALEAVAPTEVIALGRSQVHLLWWLPLTALRLAVRRSPEILVFGDVLVATALKPFIRAKTTAVIVHGLDVTFGAPGYSTLARHAIRRIDRLLAISRNTARLAVEAGARPDSLVVVYPGVAVPSKVLEDASGQCRSRLGMNPDTPLLVYVGRLVRRKGITWFVEDVMKLLPSDIHLVIVGDGPEKPLIEAAVAEGNLTERVRLLGSVPDGIRDLFMQGADLVVMPNIPVDKDPEGFGLVGVEATLRHTPVLGTRIDAVAEALGDGACGFLTDPLDALQMAQTIEDLFRERSALRAAGESFAAEASRRFAEAHFPDRLWAALAG